MMKKKVTNISIIFCVLLLASKVLTEEEEEQEKYPSGIPIKINLESSWGNTPLLLEALELLSKEAGEPTYQQFIASYRINNASATPTAQTQYRDLCTKIAATLPEHKKPLVELGLASRTYSPAVAFHAELQPPSSLLSSDSFTYAVIDRHLIVTSVKQLSLKTIRSAKTKKDVSVVPQVVENVDHIIKRATSKKSLHEIYLYGVPGTELFVQFHNKVLSLIENENDITYVVRYAWDKNGNGVTGALSSEQSTPLQGYGVEFSLKSVEYKTIDERRNTPDSSKKITQANIKETSKKITENTNFNNEANIKDTTDLIEKSDHFDKMEANALRNIGMDAALHVLSSPPNTKLRTLRKLTGDFPAYAANLARDSNNNNNNLDKNTLLMLRQDLAENSRRWGSDGAEEDNQLMINGAPVNPGENDWFSLVSAVEAEMDKAAALCDTYGVANKKDAVDMLSTPLPRAEDVASDIYYNISSPHIAFINNLESDKVLYGWYPHSVENFLRPNRNGFRYVARNLINVVFAFNPSDTDFIRYLAYFYEGIRKDIPYRFGILMHTTPDTDAESVTLKCDENGVCTDNNDSNKEIVEEPDMSRLIAKIFYYIRDTHSSRIALYYFSVLNRYTKDDEPVYPWMVKSAYLMVRNMNGKKMAEWDTFVRTIGSRHHSKYNAELAAVNAFMEERGIVYLPITFANGVVIKDHMSPRRLVWLVNSYIVPKVADLIRRGALTDDTEDPYSEILRFFGAFPRISRFASVKPAYTQAFLLGNTAFDRVLAESPYFHSANPSSVKHTSGVVCIDPSNSAELALAQRLLHALRSDTRLALFARTKYDVSKNVLWRAIRAAASIGQERCSADIGEYLIKTFAERVKSGDNTVTVKEIVSALEADVSFDVAEAVGKLLKEWDSKKNDVNDDVINDEIAFCSAVNPAVSSSAPAIVLNSRVTVLNTNDVPEFNGDDFAILQHIEGASASKMYDSIITMLLKPDRPFTSTTKFIDYRSFLQMKAVAQSTHDNNNKRKRSVPTYIHNSFTEGSSNTGDDDDAMVQIDLIADPLSRTAQRYAPILERLAEALPVRVNVFFTPQLAYENLPLKTFYRYVLDADVAFDSATGALLPSSIHGGLVAEELPSTRLITLGMEVPHKWIVMASKAVHDLDNIRLGEAEKNGDTSIDATFRLEHILVEGSCYEEGTTDPARALELELTQQNNNHADAAVSDTLVMNNFGYFQLKAAPGLWDLHIRSGGRSDLIYSIKEEGEEFNSNSNVNNGNKNGDGITVVVNSMNGAFVKVYATKKEGHEKESLLDDENVDYVKSINNTENNNNDDNTINVFAIASGHLYERFVKIMMLSVLRGTKSPVKFWFIKNYLSPQFKEVIGDLSKHYGFDYGLITYKWPSWLFAQTEKQRIIWGYKILFLDVIFPLGLKKVIYVDADQVVRSDLRELMEIPLDGAPIAMTPFCRGSSRREETKGYRFWDQGFWKEHLEGKPYHISALFVVDLQRFRRIGAGDTYRSVYDGLAHDPNSLSNLDQDLPNYLQDRVPLKSLPQEWLWCQTWCSDESKSRAKTIDLCNNPMTKIPKLDSARINIPEWDELDGDIHKTEVEILKNKTNKN